MTPQVEVKMEIIPLNVSFLSKQIFEDQNEAVRYCDLMQGGGQGCEGVAEIEASSVRNLTMSANSHCPI